MASKRKSTTPCMVLTSDPDPDVEMNSDVEECPPQQIPVENPAFESISSEDDAPLEYNELDDQSQTVEGGYECKYCSFQTPDLNRFTFHVDSEHPNVVLNSSYFCVECNFLTKRYDSLSEHNMKYHPGEENFKLTMVKRNNQSIFEQTVNDLTFDGSFVQEENQEQSESNSPGISISKTPIMKIMKDKSEKKRITVSQNALEESEENDVKQEIEPNLETPEEKETLPLLIDSEPVKTMNTVITNTHELSTNIVTPATVFQSGLAQVITTVQAQQNCNMLSKVLIPLNSIPSYNAALDSNPVLLNAYNKFPYPTVSEITLLAVHTKCTEEQIKIWFSAQRLKHGVSWTPEEVEEARRKQFNGTVHTVPQTITVIPAHISSATNGLPSILQTCQIVGQPSLVLTQVSGTNALPVTTPIALTVAGVPNNAQIQKKHLPPTQPVTETKQMAAVPTPKITKQEPSTGDVFNIRAKKTKEQLTALKISYIKSQFPNSAEIERLIRVTGLTKGEVKKWFSDTRYNQRNSKGNQGAYLPNDSNSTIIIDSEDPPELTVSPHRSRPSWNPLPDFTPQKFKEKTAEQIHVLEESFNKSHVPSDEELNNLRGLTKLTRREIDAWFTEKRKSIGIKVEDCEPNDSNPDNKTKDDENSNEGGTSEYKSRTPIGSKLAKKTPEQLHILKSAFVRSQWPTPAEYDKLAEESGLPRGDIVGWFGDTRYACKNHLLRWCYEYQTGNESSPNVMNGQSFSRRRGRGRPRGRGRGRSRGRPKGPRRIDDWDKSNLQIKYKTGKAALKDYYIMHKFLNEEDLDELVAKSHMGYEQVREWFAERLQREDAGLAPFDDDDDEEEEDMLDDQEEDEEIVETDDSDTWEPPRHVRRRLSKMED
ncbi:zinc fingers and homeoboxes protein 1 [Bombina bombina]|uniref:zinc fingers and homeoboxes protein 1 n=1 Tax=Bombina bombina TaxID=8345 RepID=UPI00235A8D8F|nr:zinc fingers and homeoboxes protein 1 [Bombina bombina]